MERRVRYLMATVAMGVLSGCLAPPPAPSADGDWRGLSVAGVPLAELEAIRDDVPRHLPALRGALNSADTLSRQRVANILERLGAAAAPAAGDLAKAFAAEEDPVTAAWLARALAATGDAKTGLPVLRRAFRKREHGVLRAYLAGAVLRLDSLAASHNELQYLIDSLNPHGELSELATDDSRNLFWERRWAAAYMIARLGTKGAPLAPALEQCAEAGHVPVWVRRQVYFALREVTAAETH